MPVDPQSKIDQVVTFIKQTFELQQKKHAVIAVSGGIDSALALTLLSQALGKEHITALLLPYGTQSTEDAEEIVAHVGLLPSHVKKIDIKPLVDQFAYTLDASEANAVRFGNLKARARMMCVFDTSKSLDALVCGTENKSEHYLGYFTRFGDAASDIEPISQLYKTEVRELAAALQLPSVFLEKAPSAGLWEGQTDETEMGFTYVQADQVLKQLIDLKKNSAEIVIPGIDLEVVQKVITQVQSMNFKLQVPYELPSESEA